MVKYVFRSFSDSSDRLYIRLKCLAFKIRSEANLAFSNCFPSSLLFVSFQFSSLNIADLIYIKMWARCMISVAASFVLLLKKKKKKRKKHVFLIDESKAERLAFRDHYLYVFIFFEKFHFSFRGIILRSWIWSLLYGL